MIEYVEKRMCMKVNVKYVILYLYTLCAVQHVHIQRIRFDLAGFLLCFSDVLRGHLTWTDTAGFSTYLKFNRISHNINIFIGF